MSHKIFDNDAVAIHKSKAALTLNTLWDVYFGIKKSINLQILL